MWRLIDVVARRSDPCPSLSFICVTRLVGSSRLRSEVKEAHEGRLLLCPDQLSSKLSVDGASPVKLLFGCFSRARVLRWRR